MSRGLGLLDKSRSVQLCRIYDVVQVAVEVRFQQHDGISFQTAE